jgi:hypothetical protein
MKRQSLLQSYNCIRELMKLQFNFKEMLKSLLISELYKQKLPCNNLAFKASS